jgi:hypothetical protein
VKESTVPRWVNSHSPPQKITLSLSKFLLISLLLATAAWLGSDMINISLIFGLLVYFYYSEQPVLMTYISGRDLVFYIIAVFIIGTLYISNTYQQALCALLFAYYVFNLVFQFFNAEVIIRGILVQRVGYVVVGYSGG